VKGQSASVTVAVIPRDKFSVAPACVEALLEQLGDGHRLVVFDNGYPAAVREHLASLAADRSSSVELVDAAPMATTNELWNAFGAREDAETLVCVENDVIVGPGCLPAVLAALDSGLGQVVSPVILEGNGRDVHFDPPLSTITPCPGGLRSELVRRPKDGFPHVQGDRRVAHLERHLLAMASSTARRIGPLDEAMLCRTDIDLSLQCRAASVTIAVTTAATAMLVRDIDRTVDGELYDFRWRIDRVSAANARLIDKWSLVGYKTTVNHAHRLRARLDESATPAGS
jgi:hypothetical protein